jgi:polyisoprenoid-binding protein YceI
MVLSVAVSFSPLLGADCMKFVLWMVAGSLLLGGCAKKTPDASTASSAGNTSGSSSLAIPAGSNSADASQTANSSGPALTIPGSTDGTSTKVIELTPQNTKIQFIGKHTDPKPDRVGTFQKFNGQAVLADDSKSLESVTVDIEAGSFQTFNPGLTTHLNSPDFLDTRSHPAITFKSNRVFVDDTGRTQIVGNLTLHGVTKEVTFPADVKIEDRQLSIKSDLTIDRTEFGMNRMLEGVKKEVDISVAVGPNNEATNTDGAE